MSQNDLVIANQAFPATRADITSALQALGSTNSGPSAPSTTYANMMWYDTTSNILKIRAEANDAWISIGYLHHRYPQGPFGSGAAPASGRGTLAHGAARVWKTDLVRQSSLDRR